MNQPERRPVLLEVRQGRLCSLSFDARQANNILLNLEGTGTLLYYPSTVTQAWTVVH